MRRPLKSRTVDAARLAVASAIASVPEDRTVKVQLWETEQEQWQIADTDEPDGPELPLRVIQAYRFAAEVWNHAQTILRAEIEKVRDAEPEEAQDSGDVDEWLRGEITRAEYDARLAGCDHPEDQREPFYSGARCKACARWVYA